MVVIKKSFDFRACSEVIINSIIKLESQTGRKDGLGIVMKIAESELAALDVKPD